MKKLLFLIAFVFLLSTVFSAKIESSSINVIIDKEGTALIEETFFVVFEEGEKDLFKQNTEQGISVDIMKNFGLEIKPRLENTEAIISFEETPETNKIKLNYFSNALFSVKDKITSNQFSLNKAKVLFLFSGSQIIFPENFSLRFVLPKEAKTINVLPETKVLSNTVEWKGKLTEDALLLEYSIDKTPDQITIKETIIEVKIKENGFGGITEKYFFGFKSEEELNYFAGISEKNGTTVSVWNAFDKRFFTHISEDEFDTKNASVEFVKKGLTDSFLIITYENESPVFIENKEKEGRFVEWKFNSKKLNKLFSGGAIILPENTLLEITLPLNSEIKETNLEAKNNKVVWEGFKTASDIIIVFVITENIAPAFNLSLIVQKLVSNKESLIMLVLVLIALMVFVSLKKDSLTEKIDSFLIKNSKIEKEEESEIEIDD